MSHAARRQQGMVLVVVLFFVLLMSSSVATFVRRVSLDATVARNRDAARRADALARGGIRIGEAILIDDLRQKLSASLPDSLEDDWGRVGSRNLATQDDDELHVEIRDTAAGLNLNALADADGKVSEEASIFLAEFLERVIEAMPGRPEDKVDYDPEELAENLADWIDADDTRESGGYEDDGYQSADPPYRAPNAPILSVEELRLIEGFDGKLIEALRPYVTVFPLVGNLGVNLNTAPTWVLAQIKRGSGASGQLLDEDEVRRILEAREQGPICANETTAEECSTSISDLFGGAVIDPPHSERSSVFLVSARARVGEIERRIDAVIDRSVPSEPLRLSWRVR